MSWRALREAAAPLAGLFACAAFCIWLQLAALAFLALGLAAVVALFFRDPEREIPADPNLIVAPADGLVDTVETLEWIEAIGAPGHRISIFLSIFDVHINRFPEAGTIAAVEHKSGAFFDARRLESHRANENQLWFIDTYRGRVAVRQIAGLLARRIVGWKRPGEKVAKGERMGLIKFGSRTDLYLPMTSTVLVSVGDRVAGGQSVVARWSDPISL